MSAIGHNSCYVATEVEARLLRWGESSSAGRTVTFELSPDDGDTHPFKGVTAGPTNGQRFKLLFQPIMDDETVITETAEPPQEVRAPSTEPKSSSDRPRMPFHKLPRSNQAGIKCDEPDFQDWLSSLRTPQWVFDKATQDFPKNPNKWYGALVCYHCDVASRTLLATDEAAGKRWDAFYVRYQQDTNQLPEMRG